jgi:hypothetical protein
MCHRDQILNVERLLLPPRQLNRGLVFDQVARVPLRFLRLSVLLVPGGLLQLRNHFRWIRQSPEMLNTRKVDDHQVPKGSKAWLLQHALQEKLLEQFPMHRILHPLLLLSP